MLGPEMAVENQTHNVPISVGSRNGGGNRKAINQSRMHSSATVTNCCKCIGGNDLGVDHLSCLPGLQ